MRETHRKVAITGACIGRTWVEPVIIMVIYSCPELARRSDALGMEMAETNGGTLSTDLLLEFTPSLSPPSPPRQAHSCFYY